MFKIVRKLQTFLVSAAAVAAMLPGTTSTESGLTEILPLTCSMSPNLNR